MDYVDESGKLVLSVKDGVILNLKLPRVVILKRNLSVILCLPQIGKD